MFRTAVEGLVTGLRSLDFAAAVVAIPLAAASHVWFPDRSVETLALVFVPAVAVVAGVLWISGAWARQVQGGAGDALELPGARPVWSAAAAALLLAVALAARQHETSRTVMALAIALAAVAALRLGWSALSPRAAWPRPAGASPAPTSAPAASEDPPRSHPARPAPPAPGVVLRALRGRMDEVSYAPGSPNVLSMTKHLAGAPAAAAPAGALPDPGDARLRWSREDDGDATVLAIAGVLDALEAPAVRAACDAVVAERRTAVTVDLAGLEIIDSTGVGVLVGLLKRCRAFGGTVRVVGARRQPRAVFRLLRLEQALGLEEAPVAPSPV